MGQVPRKDDLLSMLNDLQRQIDEVRKRAGLGNSAIRGTMTVQGGSIEVPAGSVNVDGGGSVNVASGGSVNLTGGGSINLSGGGSIVINDNGELSIKDNLGRTIIELGKTSDGRYGLRVNDTAGNPQIRAGQLASGGYGLEAVDGSLLTALSALIFGPTTAVVSTAETTTSLSFTNLATAGPTVTVNIGSSGRCLVLISSRMSALPGNGGVIGVDITGASTVLAGTGGRELTYSNEGANLAVFGGSRIAFFDGLNPGSTTFTLKYAVVGSSSTTISFQDRELTVMPY